MPDTIRPATGVAPVLDVTATLQPSVAIGAD